MQNCDQSPDQHISLIPPRCMNSGVHKFRARHHDFSFVQLSNRKLEVIQIFLCLHRVCPESERVLQELLTRQQVLEEVTEKHAQRLQQLHQKRRQLQRIQAELHRKRKELSELQQEVEPHRKEAELPVKVTRAQRSDLQVGAACSALWSCDCSCMSRGGHLVLMTAGGGRACYVPCDITCLCTDVTCL